MKLSRLEAIECLLEPKSMWMHGYSTQEIRSMSTVHLFVLVNEIFEPIDLDDPYTEKKDGRLVL